MSIILDGGDFYWLATLASISVCLVFLLLGFIFGSVAVLSKQKQFLEKVLNRLEKGFKTVKKIRKASKEVEEEDKGVSKEDVEQ